AHENPARSQQASGCVAHQAAEFVAPRIEIEVNRPGPHLAMIVAGTASGQKNIAEIDQRSCNDSGRKYGVLQRHIMAGFCLFFEYCTLTEFGKTSSLGAIQQNTVFVAPGTKNHVRSDLCLVNTR